MALSEMGLSIGLRRSLQGQEKTAEAKKPAPLYSQQEITNMMLTVPAELTREKRVETPVGTWSMDGDVAIFDTKPKAEIDRITKVGKRQKLAKIATMVFQMS